MGTNEKELVESINALAEMTFIFYRHCLDIGATDQEAASMTHAYLAAIMGK